MSLSQRVTELLERWLGEGENLPQTSPKVTATFAGDSKFKVWDGTDTADVLATNGSNGLVTIEPNHISTDNSTFDLLSID